VIHAFPVITVQLPDFLCPLVCAQAATTARSGQIPQHLLSIRVEVPALKDFTALSDLDFQFLVRVALHATDFAYQHHRVFAKRVFIAHLAITI